MITIDESNNILRDGEKIGFIAGGVAYTTVEIPSRLKGSVRRAADNDDLQFVVEESKEDVEAPKATKEQEPTQEFDTSSFGCTYEDNPRYFQQCFVNTYGPHRFNEWLQTQTK